MKKFIAPLVLFLLSLGLYLATLALTVVTIFDDSLELQLALPAFAIVHPTGYPLYTLLGWLVTKTLPFGDAAFRVNLFSALAASGAVALLYAVARRLGGSRSLIPAFAAALLLAVSPVWWSQATIAEVYALQGLLTLLVVYTLLRWDAAPKGGERDKWLALAGLSIGLGLAHHRLTLLLLPAALVFVLWSEPDLIRHPRQWLEPLLAMLAPLLLYAILPLRASIGSLDGSYAEIGFWGWVLGGGYSAFLRENPFGIERTIFDLLELLVQQYGWLGIVVAAIGLPIWRKRPRQFVFLLLIALTNLLFANGYLVADIEVFLIPLFLIWALFIAAGLTVVWERIANIQYLLSIILACIFLLWPAYLALQRLPEQDRSAPPARAWGVHDYGRDMLASVVPDGTVVGILGEMTLLRYFQETAGVRPDVKTIAADRDDERLAAIAAGVEKARPTYTTRPVAGLAEQFSLSAEGPLVRVWPAGGIPGDGPSGQAASQLTPEVALAGWEATLREPRSGPSVRLSLRWLVGDRIPADFKISARVLNPDGAILAQTDDFPVHNSYPPTRWRPGETILDSYDLPLGAVPDRPVSLLVILYNPADGSELARWTQANVILHE